MKSVTDPFSPPKDLKEAKEIQLSLKRKIKLIPLGKKPKFIAGVDAAFSGKELENKTGPGPV